MPPTQTVPGTDGIPRADASAPAPSPSCNLCGASADIAIQGPPVVVSCSRCGLTSLERFPAPDVYESQYQEDYYSEETGARFLKPFEWALCVFRLLRLHAILRRAPGPGSILDVGCGRGDLLEVFKARGWRVLGTQVSRTAARAARKKRGVEVVCGELPDLGLDARRFDVITFFHVLEHLTAPDRYLRAARDLLADGGLLVVEVPDCSSPGFRALGVRSFCFDYPHHLVFFTSDSLRGLLERCGLRVEGSSRFSLEYSLYTSLQNLLNFLPGTPSRLYRAFMKNAEGLRLRKSPWTWLHAALAMMLFPAAIFLSLLAVAFPCGNTVRFYCRKRSG